MTYNFHIHVPSLFDFALFVASDVFTRNGKLGDYGRAIPFVVYWKSIQTFTIKYSIHQAEIRSNLQVANCRIFPVVIANDPLNNLDHVVVQRIHNPRVLNIVIPDIHDCNNDVSAVISAIARFHSRCRDVADDSLSLFTTRMLSTAPSRSIVDVLLGYGANANGLSLSSACRAGLAELVHLLFDQMDTVTIRHESEHRTLLADAISSGNWATIDVVLTKLRAARLDVVVHGEIDGRNLSVDTCDKLLQNGVLGYRRTRHLTFCNINSTDVVSWLHQHGYLHLNSYFERVVIDAATIGGYHITMLHHLVDTIHHKVPKDILATLLNLKSDHNSDYYRMEVFDYLIEHGADVASFEPRVHEICALARVPLFVRYFMDKGSRIFDWKNSSNIIWSIMASCLRVPFYWPAFSLVQYLLEFDINNRGPGGDTLLHHVCKTDNAGAVMLLLSMRADVGLSNNNGETPLFIACDRCDVSLVHDLIVHGASVRVCDRGRNTPLHMACRSNHSAIVHELINHGADIDIINNNGKDPFDCATNTDIMRFLLALRNKTTSPSPRI